MEVVRQEPTTAFYEFGPFLVDRRKCVLLREGEVVPLSLKAFEILLELIQHHGQMLEKQELLKRVWPDTVVEENSLARSISSLRKALDEQPNEHRYILTVPGRGYRFVDSVREVQDGGEMINALTPEIPKVRDTGELRAANGHQVTAATTAAKTEAITNRPRRTWRAWVAAPAILAVGISAVVYVFSL